MQQFDEATIERMRKLGKIFSKYTMVERMSFDFGVSTKLYPAEVHALSAVDLLGGCGVTELANELGVTKGAASQLASKLVKKGLLDKDACPEHGSRIMLRVTETGKLVSDRHLAFHFEHDKNFLEYLQALNEEEQRIVDEFCHKMNGWMDNYF